MPTFSFTSPEGKKYEVIGPEGSTQEQAFEILQGQLAESEHYPSADDTSLPKKSLVDQIPGNDVPQPKREEDKKLTGGAISKAGQVLKHVKDSIVGSGEAALTMGSSALAGVAGIAPAVVEAIKTVGTGSDAPEKAYHQFVQNNTYRPRTESGQEQVRALGEAFDASGVAGLAPVAELGLAGHLSEGAAPQVGAMARQASGKIAEGAKEVGAATRRMVEPLKKEEAPAMAGIGAANTEEATMRRQRAAELPVPIQLTKGQAERTQHQQQFERETAKLPEGEPLVQHFAEQNERILKNFDAWVDQTGAEKAGNLRAVGEVVNQAVVNKSKKAKSEIRDAYRKAKEAGEMNEPVSIKPVLDYLEEHEPEAINAPILTSVRQKIAKVDPEGTGQLPINSLEEIRKMINRLATPGTPNEALGAPIKGLIDQMTEGKGGDLYKQARKLRFNYGKEFEDRAIVAKLLRNKPGTSDRAVALEDVFQHSVLGSSTLDDVRHLRRVLQTAGDEGKQAWREIQGQTIQHLKDEVTKNITTDVRGNKILSPAKLDQMITNLDKDGKLDFIFGKKGADQLREVNKLAKDVYTAPPGSVNSSNTATALIAMLDAMGGMMTAGVPLPVGTAINYGVKRMRSNKLKARVQDAIGPKEDLTPNITPPEPLPMSSGLKGNE